MDRHSNCGIYKTQSYDCLLTKQANLMENILAFVWVICSPQKDPGREAKGVEGGEAENSLRPRLDDIRQ